MRNTPRMKPWKRLAIAGGIAAVLVLVGIGSFLLIGVNFVQQSSTEKSTLLQEVSVLEEELRKIRSEQALLGQQQVIQVQTSTRLPEGTVITADMLELVGVDRADQMPGVLTDPALALGKTTIRDVAEGELLRRDDLMEGLGPFSLEPGQRAITISVNAAASLAGELASGSYVDVLLTLEGEAGDSLTQTLLQRIRVIAVGQKSKLPSERYNQTGESEQLVTLAVNPDQAERLVLAQETGTFHLIMRPFSDTSHRPLNGVSLHQLLGQRLYSAPSPGPSHLQEPEGLSASQPALASYEVEVILGGEATQVPLLEWDGG